MCNYNFPVAMLKESKKKQVELILIVLHPSAGQGLQDFAGTDDSIDSDTAGGRSRSHPQRHLPFGTPRTRRREVRGMVLGAGRGL